MNDCLGFCLPSMIISSGNETENEIYCELFESLRTTIILKSLRPPSLFESCKSSEKASIGIEQTFVVLREFSPIFFFWFSNLDFDSLTCVKCASLSLSPSLSLSRRRSSLASKFYLWHFVRFCIFNFRFRLRSAFLSSSFERTTLARSTHRGRAKNNFVCYISRLLSLTACNKTTNKKKSINYFKIIPK